MFDTGVIVASEGLKWFSPEEFAAGRVKFGASFRSRDGLHEIPRHGVRAPGQFSSFLPVLAQRLSLDNLCYNVHLNT